MTSDTGTLPPATGDGEADDGAAGRASWIDKFEDEVRGVANGASDLSQEVAARLFVEAFGHEVRWVQGERRWYVASRSRRPGIWSPENREGVANRMSAVRAVTDSGGARQQAFVRESLTRAKQLLAADAGEFNTDPYVLGTTNGAVDLKTGELIPPEAMKAKLITKSTTVPYNPDAECPAWIDQMAVLFRERESIVPPPKPDPEMVSFMQILYGLSLVGRQEEHFAAFFEGGGRNGKDQTDTVIQHTLGDYAGVLDKSVLFAGPDAHTTGIAALEGLRHVSVSEVPRNRPMNADVLKLLTGGNEITARRMRQDNRTFSATWTLWLISNYPPNLTGDASAGMQQRTLRIPVCRHSIPEHEQDPEVEDRLKSDAEGILAWAVQGSVRYFEERAQGIKHFATGELPDRVRRSTMELREESGLLRRYLHEECTADPDGKVLLRDFAAAYSRWLEKEGERTRSRGIVPTREVGTGLRAEGHDVRKADKNKTYVFGMRMPDALDEALNEAYG